MNHLPLPYCVDAPTLFERLCELPHPVLLHSSNRETIRGRYDIVTADPARLVKYKDGVLSVGTQQITTRTPLDALRKYFTPRSREPFDHFRSGFLGYFGYALQETLERLPTAPPDLLGFPALWGGDYRWAVVTDHSTRTTRLWYDTNLSSIYVREIERRLTSQSGRNNSDFTIGSRFVPTMTDSTYRDAFDAIQRYIEQGDCYQVNLARHYAATLRGDRAGAGWAAYKHLVRSHPVPFGAYLSTPYGDIVSISPERFVRYCAGLVETSPIKGTAPRYADAEEDSASADQLQHSAKDRAENVMIVDLLRNDLGRICRPGSIRATRLFGVESFTGVHHLVSTVQGAVRPEIDAWLVLAASFPGGSVTGAPKIRAMQIINELEPVARSVYCGSIGYVDDSGAMDTNIAIRTLAFTPTDVHCWGGGGIVGDSRADAELAEIEHKIGRLLQAVAELGSSSSCRA